MIVYKDYVTFNVLGTDIDLISDTLEHGINTIANVGQLRYYLGHEQPTIAAAILAWQSINGRELTDEEFQKTLANNHL